jgi:hypothetical protein
MESAFIFDGIVSLVIKGALAKNNKVIVKHVGSKSVTFIKRFWRKLPAGNLYI